MISIPIYLKRKLTIENSPDCQVSTEHLRNYIADSLLLEEAKSVDIDKDDIYFKVGFSFWGPNWKILLPISTGIIAVKQEMGKIKIEYKLSFERLIIIGTIFALIVSLFLAYDIIHDGRHPVSWGVFSVIAMWLWLVGGNIAITAFRFPRFIKKCVSEAQKQLFYWLKK